MKTKFLTNLLMMAALAMVAMTFTACGGDDEDDIPGGDTSVGVHRVDIQFSSNASRYNTSTYIYGMKASSSIGTYLSSRPIRSRTSSLS